MKTATVFMLVCAMLVCQAYATRTCNLQETYYPSVKAYSGNIIQTFDEAKTPAMKGNDCVQLWCMGQCSQNEKCLKWSYQAVSGGKTLCTLHGASAKLANVKCINGKCNSVYGSCTGTWDE